MKVLKIIVIAALLASTACNNKVDTQVPSEIKVNVPETTQTVNVVHSFEISLQMEEFFRRSCTTQVDSVPVPLPEPQRSQAIDLCISNSVQKFITDLMSLVKQQQQQQGQ